MLLSIFRFELGLRLRRPSTAVFSSLFLLIGYLAVVRGGGPLALIDGAKRGQIDTQAPFVLHFLINVMGYLGTLIACAVFGQAGLRDFRNRMHGLYFSCPIRESEFLAGRFAAAFVAATLVFAGTGIGAWLGGAAPFSKVTAGGLARPAAYLLPYANGLLPTLLFMGAVFFAVALLTRKMLPVYAAGVAILFLHLSGRALSARGATRTVGALIDPFGQFAARSLYEVWSLAERSQRLVTLHGLFLVNRLVWLAVAASILAFVWSRFRLREVEESRPARGRRSVEDRSERVERETDQTPLVVHPGWALRLRQVWATAALELTGLVRSTAFLVILLLTTVVQVIVSVRNIGLVSDTTAYPLTSQVLSSGMVLLHPALLLIVLFCSGELIRGDRMLRLHFLLDPTPVPEAVFFFGKAAALLAVIAGVLAMAMANGMTVQAIQGWTRFEPGLYLTELFGVRFAYFTYLAVFALFAQILAGNRAIGYLITFAFTDEILEVLGFEHRLFTFAQTPTYTYSDMNGYGPFGRALFFYDLYWLFVAALIVVTALLLYARGEDLGWKARFREGRTRLTRRLRAVVVAAALGCALSGSYILYNTTVLNRFESTTDDERRKAEYETLFKSFERRPQPRARDLRATIDIDPAERRVVSRGEMICVNPTGSALSEVFVQTPRSARVRRLDLDRPAKVSLASERHGVRVFQLVDALGPGQTVRLTFDLEIHEQGFKDRGANTRLVQNGTFLDHGHALPTLSYNRFDELDAATTRKQYGLAPRVRLPSIDDRDARMSNIFGSDVDWIGFDVVLSTSADQTALTSGDLSEAWEKDGRRYFRFASRVPTLNYLPFVSAAYQVRKDRWNGIDVEVYFHPDHAFNVDHMLEVAKTSLALFGEKFGPYPFGALRIAEFPRYELSADAYPGLILLSEGRGYITRSQGRGVDELRRVIAHEVSHQWWGMQVIGAATEGEFLISETLAQHAALMVLRRCHDETSVAAYLKTRIERYLRGRGREAVAEKPLARTNYETDYVHYDKGMVVMNALRGRMGEAALDSALRALFQKAAGHAAPYPTSRELIEELKKEAPPDDREAIAEMLEKIVIYDNRMVGAVTRNLPGGKHRVVLEYEIAKRQYDDNGRKSVVAAEEDVEFAIWDESGAVLFRAKRRVRSGRGRFEALVDGFPARAGIDPFSLLMDANPDDNVVAVRE